MDNLFPVWVLHLFDTYVCCTRCRAKRARRLRLNRAVWRQHTWKALSNRHVRQPRPQVYLGLWAAPQTTQNGSKSFFKAREFSTGETEEKQAVWRGAGYGG